MNPLRRALLLACVLPAACAHRPPLPGAELPLRLDPASLGRELALQQRMTVTARGHSQQFDVALEADAAAVRVAILAFGHVLARLSWDGRELREERVRGWPPVITGALVLRDLQLVHWPTAAIRAALPAGWVIEEDARGRELRLAGRTMIRVHHPAPETAELENLAAGYRIQLQSWGRTA